MQRLQTCIDHQHWALWMGDNELSRKGPGALVEKAERVLKLGFGELTSHDVPAL